MLLLILSKQAFERMALEHRGGYDSPTAGAAGRAAGRAAGERRERAARPRRG